MNTNHLKKFAQDARSKLLEQVGAKLSFVLTTDSAELREKTEQLKQLREELTRTTKEQLIEKVAYTWFNRFMALRFMDANDYQPLGIRIITPKDGYTIPELLDEAKRGNIPEDLKLKSQKVYDLLDNRVPSTNPQNEAFKELLIAACNHLHTTFSFLFEKINDYTELLLPDDLTSDFSIVTDIRKGMPVQDCKNVEIIGWLYQFYISEKKDEVFASKARVEKEDIPAATQLFTPRWIVEYMVQNTLGKLWLQNRPKSKLLEHMPYFIESTSLKSDDFLRIDSPEEIKLADPACGSGHILVYAFDLFTKIYEEEGYNTSDIPNLIIEKNLYGFEIDERAAQLSGLALMMKAREYQLRVFRKKLQPNIICFQDLYLRSDEIKETLGSLQIKISEELMHDLLQMQQATNFGSLIIPKADNVELLSIYEKLTHLTANVDVFQRNTIDALTNSISQLKSLKEKYHCTAANPPYMGLVKMNDVISDWVKVNYSNSRADLFSCFIERSCEFIQEYGFNGLVTMESWMFLSSFEKLRKELIENTIIHSLSHFGWHVMRIAFGTVSFILEKTKSNENFKGVYSYLEIGDIDKESDSPKVFPQKDNGRYNKINQRVFLKIPTYPIGYWLSDDFITVFENGVILKEIGDTRQGMATSDNQRFIKLWHEVSFENIGFELKNHSEAKQSMKRWFPYNKGGGYRKWYGNHDYVVNWENDGNELMDYASKKYGSPTRTIKSISEYFKPSLSWSKVTAGKFSVRYYPYGFIFDVAGCCVFFNEEIWTNYLCGFLNSKISSKILEVLSPTLNYEAGVIAKLPVIQSEIDANQITSCIDTAKKDWDLRENSWDFQVNGLLTIKANEDVDFEESIDLFKQYWKNKFFKLHQKEEDINRFFINIYSLNQELSPDIQLEDISILQNELDRNSLSQLNEKLYRDPETFNIKNYHDINLPFNNYEIVVQFISYFVGCLFGRYSLDKEGLLIACQNKTLNDYLHNITKSKDECSFLPDEDNIIPILENEWFEDDIVGRFNEFLKVTFGERNFNKNIAFIEEQLGKDIRKYFIKDFYSDHIKHYKKRPIYWMLSSSNSSFNVLIYIHRYTSDTVSNILNKYLKEFIGKLNTRKEHLQHIQVSGSPSEKTKAIKENDNIDKMFIELQEYERDVLYPLATERIEIDLDNGVLVNYNKFGKAVKEISGLNDKKTKDKVKKFDWIDTTQIR